jgi:hypothetical protein
MQPSRSGQAHAPKKTQPQLQVDKGIQGSAFAARETHKNVGIAKV